ncbi:hypothetical protein D3C72_2029970 [compost metagenome]
MAETKECKRALAFQRYCGVGRNYAEADEQYKKIQKLNSRSGTKNLQQERAFQAAFMRFEERFEEHSRVSKANGGPELSATDWKSVCQIDKRETPDGMLWDYSKDVKEKIKTDMKKSCGTTRLY